MGDKKDEFAPLYYMRDNHTFKQLSEDVEEGLSQIKVCWDEGYTSGMLCSDRPNVPNVHARYKDGWGTFSRQVRAWYKDIRDASLANVMQGTNQMGVCPGGDEIGTKKKR
jgi:hypothetical protein